MPEARFPRTLQPVEKVAVEPVSGPKQVPNSPKTPRKRGSQPVNGSHKRARASFSMGFTALLPLPSSGSLKGTHLVASQEPAVSIRPARTIASLLEANRLPSPAVVHRYAPSCRSLPTRLRGSGQRRSCTGGNGSSPAPPARSKSTESIGGVEAVDQFSHPTEPPPDRRKHESRWN